MAHNKKLVIGGVDLVKVRLKHIGPAMVTVADDVEKLLIDSDFFTRAPFSWVSLVIRNGLENKFTPIFHRINKKYGDLPISVEVDTHTLLDADLKTVEAVYRRATIEALIHVAHKYHLPTEALEKHRAGNERGVGSH